jgi:transcription antitermination factor NusG
MNAPYHIGQIHPPAEPRRGIVHGPEIAPVWHALIVPPQKELAVREYLRARDIYAFFPSESRTRHIQGRKITTERPIVTQHVYAQFRQAPQWDVMKRTHRLITGVFGIGNRPIAIPRDIIRHLQGLTVEAEKLREARAEMLRVRAGDQATITEGPLTGFVVNVEDVRGGEVIWETLTGIKGRGHVKTLERRV